MPDHNERLPQEIIERLSYLMDNCDMERMSRNLRKVFFDYLRFQTAGPDVAFDEILNDIENMIEFLDLCHDCSAKT